MQEHANVEQEPKPTPEGVPPAYWRASSQLIVENLTTKHNADGPNVLHGINFHIRSGERVGVAPEVGRVR
jgi:ABC-type bacteriocin/lantibiotic exporter with double-glycine peptidase domain